MYCQKCATKLPEDSGFCHRCGLSVNDTIGNNVAPAREKPRKTLKTAVISIALALFVAGGVFLFLQFNTKSPIAPMPSPEDDYISDVTPEPSPENDAQWAIVYLDYIYKSMQKNEYFGERSASLIYINDDDVPELVILDGSTADGSPVSTISNGEVKTLNAWTGGVYYIPRKNLLLDKGGKMGEYWDTVYKIQDGGFVSLHKGEYFADEPPQWDSNDNLIIETYRWDGKEVSEPEYKKRLEAVFSLSKAVGAEIGAVSVDEMIQQLKEMLSSEYYADDRDFDSKYNGDGEYVDDDWEITYDEYEDEDDEGQYSAPNEQEQQPQRGRCNACDGKGYFQLCPCGGRPIAGGLSTCPICRGLGKIVCTLCYGSGG